MIFPRSFCVHIVLALYSQQDSTSLLMTKPCDWSTEHVQQALTNQSQAAFFSQTNQPQNESSRAFAIKEVFRGQPATTY